MKEIKPTPANAWYEFTTWVKDPNMTKPLPMCGLCANSGFITTIGIKSLFGPCGMRGYCICPNGRANKKQATGSKWGGSSVIRGQGVTRK